MKRKHKIYLRIGGTFLFLLLFIKGFEVLLSPSVPSEHLIGQEIPEGVLETKEGKHLERAAFQEGPTVLVFAASWCPACQRLEKILKDFPGKVWAIAYKDPSLSQKISSSYQQVLQDPEGKLAAKWQIQGIPTMLVIDRQGKVVWHHNGALTKARLDSELIPFMKACAEGKCP